MSEVLSIEGDTIIFEGTAADPDSVLNTVSSYQADDVEYLVGGFTAEYEEKAILETTHTIDNTQYTFSKVPQDRIYFYKGEVDLTIGESDLQLIVGDLADPFTFVAPIANVTFDPLLTENIEVNGMFIVGGDIDFSD